MLPLHLYFCRITRKQSYLSLNSWYNTIQEIVIYWRNSAREESIVSILL